MQFYLVHLNLDHHHLNLHYLDQNLKILRKIQEKIIELREAHVTQIERTKSIVLNGSADITEARSGKSIISEQLQLSIDFYSEAYRVKGDQRALPERIRNSRRQIENFPSDIDLILQGQEEMIVAYENILDRYID